MNAAHDIDGKNTNNRKKLLCFEGLYLATNENLESITAGLYPTPQDVVLAIGGSGDQAFALLEYGCKVLVIEYEREQHDLISSRIAALKEKNLGKFLLNPDSYARTVFEHYRLQKSRDHFSPRVDVIHNNLGNIHLLDPRCIWSAELAGVTMVYLSNAATFDNPNLAELEYRFNRFSEKLPLGSKIYVADHEQILDMFSHGADYPFDPLFCDELSEQLCDMMLPKSIRIDRRSSMDARKPIVKEWTPAVYRTQRI